MLRGYYSYIFVYLLGLFKINIFYLSYKNYDMEKYLKDTSHIHLETVLVNFFLFY